MSRAIIYGGSYTVVWETVHTNPNLNRLACVSVGRVWSPILNECRCLVMRIVITISHNAVYALSPYNGHIHTYE